MSEFEDYLLSNASPQQPSKYLVIDSDEEPQ